MLRAYEALACRFCAVVVGLLWRRSVIRGVSCPPVWQVQYDFICSVCEGEHNLIHCEGACLRSFHRQCIGLNPTAPANRFFCRECTLNQVRSPVIIAS